MTDETFTLHPDHRITRDSDGEHIATYRDGEFHYTHPQRKIHYAEAIESRFSHLADTPTDSPAPAANATGGPPPRHLQLGDYSPDHLVYDHQHLPDPEFLAKWDGPMQLSALHMARELEDPSIRASLISRLDH